MGTYASSFHQSGGQILLESTDPCQANWITAHAEACQLTIPEVQRCWSRFLLLQPDRKGNVPCNRFLTDERFSHQLLQQMPLVGNDLVTFQTYCSAVSWFSKSSLETKLRGLYQTMASNNSLNQKRLEFLLQDVYPTETPETISQLSQLLLSKVDSNHQGYIDEEQFVAWILKLPQDDVKSVLHFSIIPEEIITASKGQSLSLTNVETLDETSAVTDKQLLQIASEMSVQKRDWRLLANNLGFLEQESCAFEVQHSEVNQQILEMLQAWLKRAEPLTSVSVLQRALWESGNSDIRNEVFQLSF
ncbi:uncharacterized protein LOC132390859 isoform X1 [Hypanus sabinus]|uniref:uncharacterized protein LOC132390859 isoform X1 n=1 Tax=Hypanus sabinus TaxID=79690 RepID=UPI0028C3E584|nr:uncharacterized protein LOC132390859 isoform X1 [Hypanus sabinus]XP_059819381.1 uncharacterized protein LOC132390859 isoform X1 [Hypanus sabinus]XP_059819382.1 uncharacterized protein LOC132390859 isoform X1 [Hypanus sabinus]